MKKYYIFLVGLLYLGTIHITEAQQIPQFSQYMFNPIFINPAYAGYKESLYAHTYYRKQWAGVTGSPETFAVSVDGFLPGSGLGIGGYVIHDQIGAQKTTSAYGNIAYHLRLTEERFLSFGLGVGAVNSSIDESLLISFDPNDPFLSTVNERIMHPDFTAGLFLYDDLFFLGIAGENLASIFMDFDRGDVIRNNRAHANVSGGMWIDMTNSLALRPTFLFMDDFKAPARLDLNTSLVINDKYWIGASYRTGVDYAGRIDNTNLKRNTAIVGLVEFWLNNGLRIGYAYDYHISGFDFRNLSTHDISIGYTFPQNRFNVYSPKYF